MTRDPKRSSAAPSAPDDERLAELVRATTDGWSMPPQRLDQPTWRDRVGSRAGGRRRRSWLSRLAGPATAAVLGTIVVAFVAVWFTTPRPGPIAGASPSTHGGSPGPSPVPSNGVLPSQFIGGALPDPSSVVVRDGLGYRIAHLATGTSEPIFVGPQTGPSALVARPSGGWICICSAWTASQGGRPTRLDVMLQATDGAGRTQSADEIRSIVGHQDPGLGVASQPELLDMRASGSADGHYAFVGWSAKDGANGWTMGIDVVDTDTAKVVSSMPTLVIAEPAGAADRPTTRIAPRVTLAPSGDAILISSFWYVEDPSATPPSGLDHWMVSFDGTTIGDPRPAGSIAGEACGDADSGPIDATMYYEVCVTQDGRIRIDRHRADGTPVDETEIPGTSSGLEEASLIVRRGDRLFIWDPIESRLVRFDLHTAVLDSGTGTAAVPATAPWDAVADLGRRLGRWMAPPAQAKVLVQPAVVVSSDGTRVYAIGVDPHGGETIASRGIFVFDADTLDQVDHWAPTADLVSLAISPDGRFVYAAGDSGRTAAGDASEDEASITVYATTDGSVRLIAGRLGSDTLFFPEGTAR